MQAITDDVWELTSTHTMPGGVVFPLRSTVIRLPDGALWIHSPLAFTDEQAAAIEAHGEVKHLVGPSRMHDLHLRSAAERWPGARVYGPAGLLRALELDGTALGPSPWDAIELVALQGTKKTEEIVFCHRPSRSVLVTDLVFNFGPAPNWPTAFLRGAIGCRERLAASRSWRFVFADDMGALASSVDDVLALDFDRLIPCHGAVVESDGKRRLREALSGRIP